MLPYGGAALLACLWGVRAGTDGSTAQEWTLLIATVQRRPRSMALPTWGQTIAPDPRTLCRRLPDTGAGMSVPDLPGGLFPGIPAPAPPRAVTSGVRLVTVHNLFVLSQLVDRLRQAIAAGRLAELMANLAIDY